MKEYLNVILFFVRLSRKDFILLLIFSFFLISLELLSAITIFQTLSGFKQINLSMFYLLILLFLVTTAKAILEFLFQKYLNNYTSKQIAQMQNSVFETLTSWPWPRLQKLDKGLVSLVTTEYIESSVMLYISTIKNLISIMLVIVFGFYSMVLGPVVALIALFFGVIYLLIVFNVNKRLKDRYENEVKIESKFLNQLNSFLSGMKLWKIYNNFEISDQVQNTINEKKIIQNKILNLGQVTHFFRGPLIVGLILCSYLLMIDLPSGFLLFDFYLFYRIFQKVSLLISSTEQISYGVVAFTNLKPFLETSFERSQVISYNSSCPLVFSDSLKIRKLNFEFDGKLLFNDFDLKILKNQVVTIEGASGVGKSTLIDIICALYPQKFENLFLDNNSFTNIDCRSFQKNIGIVSGNFEIFPGTLLFNLTGRNDQNSETHKNVKELLSTFQLEHFTQALNDSSWANYLGISTGERQRLSLVRAILRDPQILILDEVTANLDLQNIKIISDFIIGLKNKMTIISIGHQNFLDEFSDQKIMLRTP